MVPFRTRTVSRCTILAGEVLAGRLDAIAWPLIWMALVIHLDSTMSVGIFRLVVLGVAPLCAVSRLHRALWVNHRYRFTTWRWGKPVLMLWAVGALMKLAVMLG